MKQTWARRTLAGLAVLAGLEWVTSAFVYRDRIAAADWPPLAQRLQDEPTDAVRLATDWLGPRARMEVPALARASAAAPADLHGVETLAVVGLGSTRWSDELDRQLEGRPRPHLRSETAVGPFNLAQYVFPAPQTTLADWVRTPPSLSTPQGTCSGRTHWKCKEGSVRLQYVEVDYRPRRCFSAALDDGVPLRFTQAAMPLGTTLRGHIGVTDFNARLRSDAPIRVEATIDGVRVARFVVTDEEGWRPFEIATSSGTADVEFTLLDTVRGTWDRAGLQSRGARSICFELRSIAEGGE